MSVTVPLLAIAAGVGSAILSRRRSTNWQPLEEVLFSTALGLGICAYVLFILGIAGLLRPIAVATAALLLIAPATYGVYRLYHQYSVEVASPESPSESTSPSVTIGGLILSVVLCVAGVTSFLQCALPPGAHEWDSLSYHLAVPKAFVRAGGLIELPTDHHSYFPFLTQMLYTVAIMAHVPLGAKFTHWFFGVLAAAAVYAMGRRWTSRTAGLVAAVVSAVTPMVLWEASTAYIELAQTAYVVLMAHAVLLYRSHRTGADAAVSGALGGLALAVKTLSLVPVVLLSAILLFSKPKRKHAAVHLLLLLLLGAPFYIRTWALTGNPVYPFAYSVFGGKYWDARRAAIYAGEQRSYGLDGRVVSVGDDLRPARRPYVSPSAADRLRNVILAPFALVSLPRLFHNYNDPWPLATLGFLPLAFFPLAFVPNRMPPETRVLAILTAVWFAAWSVTMQYARYLIPLVPIAALAGAWGIEALRKQYRSIWLLVLVAIGLQSALVLDVAVRRTIEYADAIFNVSESADADALRREVNIYDSAQWINHQTPPAAGVVLFEETRGYLLDGPVLWGNSPHSTYIPYETFRNGSEMVSWFTKHHIRYALVNLQFAPQAATPEGSAKLRGARTAYDYQRLFVSWYQKADRYGERWRALLADALRTGEARVVEEATFHGTVVLALGRSK